MRRGHGPFVGDRRRATELGLDLETRRANAQKLIRTGAIVTPGTDNYWAAAPEFANEPKPDNQSHGIGTIIAIEGLVELGMTPAEAIVAGTKNGAIACRRLKDFGTLEVGKLADLVVLDADPLADIHNIRKVRSVMVGGRMMDPSRLPEKRVLSTARVPLSAQNRALLLNPESPEWNRRAPDVFQVRFDTTKGVMVWELHRDWAPIGVDRFYNLVRAGYYRRPAISSCDQGPLGRNSASTATRRSPRCGARARLPMSRAANRTRAARSPMPSRLRTAAPRRCSSIFATTQPGMTKSRSCRSER